jgi:hypothetical protein
MSTPPRLARVHPLIAMCLIAGCNSGDMTEPAVESPVFNRSVRVATLEITTFPGDPIDNGALHIFTQGTPVAVQVKATDKKGRPLSRIDISAQSVAWAAHWPGFTSPPTDPAAQTVTTGADGTATFALLYPNPMLRIVTWRATAGREIIDVGLVVSEAGIGPFCSAFFGQYTREQSPDCFE